MKLINLHEVFLDAARRQINFSKLPIEPLKNGAAIISVDKWEKVLSPIRLHKTFRFVSQEKRNEFIQELFEYEAKTQHNATIIIDENNVTLDIRTKDVDQITELDKEYAKFADVIFRDIAYSRSDTDNEF